MRYRLPIKLRVQRLRWWAMVLPLLLVVGLQIGGDAGGDPIPGPAALSTTVEFSDTGARAGAASVWGEVDCQADTRVRLLRRGGDPSPTASGAGQRNSSFRRLKVIDGDDFYGERCELGRNDHRSGPTALYDEGERWITFVSVRLPRSFPLAADKWQGVLQIKQTQPAAGGGGGPALALSAFGGRWMLSHSLHREGTSPGMEQLWSVPARRRVWTRFAFDVFYSQDPDRGRVKVRVDRNGDGDTDDRGEQSPAFRGFTLKREIAGGGDDGIEPGESIPSHLRVGVYHHDAISCPAPRGCAVDLDNVQAMRVDRR